MTDLNDTQPIEPVPGGPTPEQVAAQRISWALTGVRMIPELAGYIARHQAAIDALNADYDAAVAEIGVPLTVEKLTARGLSPEQSAELVAEYNARG